MPHMSLLSVPGRKSKVSHDRDRFTNKEQNLLFHLFFKQGANKDLMMETVSTSLVCCLLMFSLDWVQTENLHLINKATENPGLNLKQASTVPTSTNSLTLGTTSSDFTEGSTQFTSSTTDNEQFSSAAATAENTSVFQTSQSTSTSLTDSTSPETIPPSTGTPTFTLTTHTVYTTPPPSPTGNSPPTVFTTVNTTNTTTHGLNLNGSEKNLTIIFSVVLGVILLALLTITLCKYRYKVQYMHQTLDYTNETDGLVADNDTLVISGGLYDGHPIYDNVPPVPSEPSQFRLEFLQ